jgi:hypothetical protein
MEYESWEVSGPHKNAARGPSPSGDGGIAALR